MGRIETPRAAHPCHLRAAGKTRLALPSMEGQYPPVSASYDVGDTSVAAVSTPTDRPETKTATAVALETSEGILPLFIKGKRDA